MTSVKLRAADGKYIVSLDLPPFRQQPQVILWGARVFVRAAQTNDYVEAFCYAVPE